MRRRDLAFAALALVSARPPVGPTRDEALRCYLMTHPNQEPLQVERWPELNRGRNPFL